MRTSSPAHSLNPLAAVEAAEARDAFTAASSNVAFRASSEDQADRRDQPALSVCMVPVCSDNPYQRELSFGLRRAGIRVVPQNILKGLVFKKIKDRRALDVVHVHWLRVFSYNPVAVARLGLFLLRLYFLRTLGCSVVWTVHNLSGHEARHPRIERFVAKLVAHCASRLIVHSPTAARLVQQEYRLEDREKIHVVPHGNYIGCYPNTLSREEARSRLGLPTDSTVLLFLGKIRPYKGVKELVTCFQDLAASGAELVVAGSPLNAAVEADVRGAVRSEHVHLHPRFIADEEIQLYMNAADAVVLPFQDVLTSGSAILAMSFGKACIAARIGCIPDILDDAGALLYDPSDADGLAGALRKALADPVRLKVMGRYNQVRALSWGWDEIATSTADVYQAAHVI